MLTKEREMFMKENQLGDCSNHKPSPLRMLIMEFFALACFTSPERYQLYTMPSSPRPAPTDAAIMAPVQ